MLVEIEDLRKKFRLRRGTELTAVDGVSFSIERGETVGLVGESGSGKSTIGRCVLRLLQPDAGVIRFDGAQIQQLSQPALRPFRPRMQKVFQDPLGSLNPAYSVERTLLDALRQVPLTGAARRTRVRELLGSVGLDERFLQRRPHEMSGGQLQRVGIARALASDPEFVFLDEPTSSLDLSVRGQIINLLADLQAERRLAYLFASHDLGVVRFLAHRVLVLYDGRVVESGPADEVLERPSHPYTQALIAGAGLADQATVSERSPDQTDHTETSRDGCRYVDRCPHAHDRCGEEPPLLSAGEQHLARCWLVEPRSADSPQPAQPVSPTDNDIPDRGGARP